MPKILIKETDLSSAGVTSYSNFSVVVPGFCSKALCGGTNQTPYAGLPAAETAYPCLVKITDAATTGYIDGCTYYYAKLNDSTPVKVFDENDVAEFDSASDFVTYIGKDETAQSTTAVAPTITKINEKTEPQAYSAISAEDRVAYAGCFYKAEQDTTTAVGYLHDLTYKYILDESPADEDTVCVIEAGKEGVDSYSITSYGNKMAYELLTLGYPVYFKLITAINDVTDATKFEALEDKSLYDFRYITHGLVTDIKGQLVTIANKVIADVASERGDCEGLLEIPSSAYVGKTQSAAVTGIKAAVSNGDKYSAYFAPYVEYSYSDTVYSNKFPACFHYLACAARSMQSYNEWFAVAGYTRGISNYTISNVGCKLGDAATSALQPRKSGGISKAVNLIVTLPAGYILWGNRTAESLDATDLKFSHFLNIRQLCTTLKKQLYTTCRQLTYDPNSDVLWMNFCGAIRPTLEVMKANQGINDYAFVKLDTNMKGKLFAAVRIVPIEAVEDFEIGVTLEDNLDNPTVTISEDLTAYSD